MISDFIGIIYKRIVALNSLYDVNSIPYSDSFCKDTESLFGLSTHEIVAIIKMLNESHKIFVMEISKEEHEDKKEKLYGYIAADITIIEKLQAVFHKGLADEYELKYGTRKGAYQIIKELVLNLKNINNSILGIFLNKALMLDNYAYLLKKNHNEYTEEWKNEHLKQQLANYESLSRKDTGNDKNAGKNDTGGKGEAARPVRAVDSPFMEDFTKLTTIGSIEKVLNIYGVDFFFRVNLRKYQFSYLSQIIDTGIIDRRNDLLMIKEMLKKVKENIHKDKGLEKYYDDIMSLDRKITLSISSSRM
jgi:hypothetical protein